MSLNKQHSQQSQTSNVQWGVKQLNVIHLFTFITFRYLDKVTVSAASVKGILRDLVQSLFAARMTSQNICAAVIYCLVYIVTFKFYYRLNLATSLSPDHVYIMYAMPEGRPGLWVHSNICIISCVTHVRCIELHVLF